MNETAPKQVRIFNMAKAYKSPLLTFMNALLVPAIQINLTDDAKFYFWSNYEL